MTTTTKLKTLQQAVVWRDGKVIHLAFQSKGAKGLSEECTPLLVATKNKGELLIYDSSQEIVGRLCLLRKTFSFIHYGLFNGKNDKAIASFVYNVPSVSQALLSPGACRTTSMAWISLDSNGGDTKEWLAKAVEACISKTGSIRNIGDFIQQPQPDLLVARNVRPYLKTNGTFALNLGGRGREPSRKNIQMEHHSNDIICFQMAKWSTNVYHVDFVTTLPPMVAFGFVLAQMDL